MAGVGGALDCTGILIGHAHNNVNSTSIKQKLQHKNTGPLIVNNNPFNPHLFPLLRLLPTFQLPQCYVMIIPPPPYTPPRLLPQQKDEVCGISSLNAVRSYFSFTLFCRALVTMSRCYSLVILLSWALAGLGLEQGQSCFMII